MAIVGALVAAVLLHPALALALAVGGAMLGIAWLTLVMIDESRRG